MSRYHSLSPAALCHGHIDPSVTTVNQNPDAVGQPCAKPLLGLMNTVSIITLAVCLLVSILVVTPDFSLAWRLGFKNQIVVIGFLLSVMSICLRNLSFTTLLAVEACWGHSRLQNYDAIFTGNIVTSHTSTYLRTVLLLLYLLPLGLSVGYKQFLGGQSSITIHQKISHARYGVDYPSLGEYSSLSTATYLWLNAYSGFSARVPPNSTNPLPDAQPYRAMPYGYNVLLLNNESAAVLDLPSRAYINSIRQLMHPTEKWHITASVNAFVSEMNSTLDALRDDENFWKKSFQWSGKAHNYQGLTSLRRGGGWQKTAFGFIPEYQNNSGTGHGSCLLGLYPDATSPLVGFTNYSTYNDPVVVEFRKHALLFDIRRRKCRAEWQISTQDIRLVSGHCYPNTLAVHVDPKVVENYAPPSIDCLPNLWATLSWLNVSTHGDGASTWKIPSYAIAVAISYWSRSAFLMDPGTRRSLQDVDYAPSGESIRSTRPTLRVNWLLYLILSIQPALGLVGVLVTVSLYGAPIGTGFGLIATLAGVQRSSLDILGGAGFSGEVNQPISLQIQEQKCTEEEVSSKTDIKIKYVLSTENTRERQFKIDKATVYS